MKVRTGSFVFSISALLYVTMYPLHPAASEAATVNQTPKGIAPGAVPNGDACPALVGLRLKNVEIASATSLAEGLPVLNSGLSPMYGNAPVVANGLPAFCRIVGHIRPEKGSDIGFEVWMPSASWDGRLNGVGIGGFAGAIDYHTLGLALKGGQASVATDTGHGGGMMESKWAKGHPERVRDYGWRAIHLSTVAAKRLVAAFYGRAPEKSYFVGCSGGGRQGLMEAARFPADYDGVLSGAPAANFTDLAVAMINPIQAQLAPGGAIRPEQARLLQEEVLRQCDSNDGQVDGMIDDPRQCQFDAAKLACGTSNSPQCFSEPQIAALRRIYSGPRDTSGRKVAEAYLPSGSEAGSPSPLLGWEGYILRGTRGSSGGETLATGILMDLVQRPFASPATFNFDKDPERLRAVSHDLDAPTNLSRFFARGGKLIIWHGWADAAIPPEASLSYYTAMLRQSGVKAKTSARLFMVQGVQHCFGGLGPDTFGQGSAPARGESPECNMVAALQSWTEGARPAPDSLVGRFGHGMPVKPTDPFPDRQRLLCAWPKKAVLQPGSAPDQAASYTCK